MGKILKKGWFVIVVIFITFTFLGFLIPWTLCKGSGRIIKFKYTTKLDIDTYDFTREENINKVKELSYSMYTGNSVSTYKYANITNNGVIIMCRINPSLIRIPKGQYQNDEWITDGTRNTIRPYRLLYKLNKNNNFI